MKIDLNEPLIVSVTKEQLEILRTAGFDEEQDVGDDISLFIVENNVVLRVRVQYSH